MVPFSLCNVWGLGRMYLLGLDSENHGYRGLLGLSRVSYLLVPEGGWQRESLRASGWQLITSASETQISVPTSLIAS